MADSNICDKLPLTLLNCCAYVGILEKLIGEITRV